MLKADLHLHAKEDKHHKLRYSAKELINHASTLSYKVLSFTFHEHIYFNKELADYAKKKGILLIPGVERYIEGREVLIYNTEKKEAEKLNTFEDLKRLREKRKDILIIAPHPFFLRLNCLRKKLIKNIDLFDAIEYSYFYLKYFNRNKKGVEAAKKYNKAILGSSDAHNLNQLDHTYSLIDAKPTTKSVFKAIKNNKVKLKTKPLPINKFLSRTIRVILKLE